VQELEAEIDVNTGLVQQIALFAGLPAEELQHLDQLLVVRSFRPGSLLFREDDPSESFAVILEGEVEIIKELGSTSEHFLALLGPGEILGEMSLLYPERRRSAGARARSAVKVVEVGREEFSELIRRQPALALRIMQAMSTRLRNSENATIRDLQEKNRQLALAYQELQAAQALVIEKEKLEHELGMARKIQQSILPKATPALDGWRIDAHWKPARAVSGDFYDFIALPQGKWGIVIGDVTDKGVPAALVMATTRSVIRSTALNLAETAARPRESVAGGRISPGEVLARVNDLLLADMPANMFVTCQFLVLDPLSGNLCFANAGHDLPCLRTGEGAVVELRAAGMPLGLMPGMTYAEQQADLAPGDLLVLISDGLVEAHTPQREMFGVPRFKKLLAAAGAWDGEGVIGYLLRALAEFTGPDWEQEDDVTLVAVQREAR
jgi:serine phosphatase RsbU (regulator of sigma subunit)